MEKTTRMILCGQYKIREKIAKLAHDNDEIEYCHMAQEILTNGYYENYYELDCMVENEFSKEDSDFVWDVLEMYRAIIYKYNSSEELRSEYPESKICFGGFDLNDETYLYTYYEFLVEKDNRYRELLGKDGHAINSHFPRSSKYKMMLDNWKEMGKPIDLSDEQFHTLVN